MDKNTKRSAEEILKDFIDAVPDHEYNRNAEWEFIDQHGDDPSYWDEEDAEEHERILEAIRKTHDRLQALCREASGDNEISF